MGKQKGDDRELHLALLKEQTKEIKLHYSAVCHSFMKSFLRREEKGEVTMELFEFGSSGPFTTSTQLLHEIRSRQSHMEFKLLEALIEKCGSEGDIEHMQKYNEAFAVYAKRRTYECEPDLIDSEHPEHGTSEAFAEYANRKVLECEPDLIGSELPKHVRVIFALDEDQRLADLRSFKLRLSEILGIGPSQIILHSISPG